MHQKTVPAWQLSNTHRQTQRIHSWIALGLRKVQKLVPCELNTQILSYDHFSGQNLRKILGHSWRQFSLQPNYSKSGEGSTSHFQYGKNTPTSNELTDFEKIVPKGTNCYRKFCPSLSPILPTAELLLRAEALRVMSPLYWLWADSRRSAPGRAAKRESHSWSWRFFLNASSALQFTTTDFSADNA